MLEEIKDSVLSALSNKHTEWQQHLIDYNKGMFVQYKTEVHEELQAAFQTYVQKNLDIKLQYVYHGDLWPCR